MPGVWVLLISTFVLRIPAMTTVTHSPVFECLSPEQIAVAEARFTRLRKIPNIAFARYDDYRAVGRRWEAVTRADGDVPCRNLKRADSPESAEKYLRALSIDNSASGEIYFYAPCASGSDYSGSLIELSNHNVLIENYGKDKELVFSAYGGYGTYAAVVSLTGLLTCADDVADSLLDRLEGLADYPLLDEEAYSALEAKFADLAWEAGVAEDFRRAVERRFDGIEFDWPADDVLRIVFERLADEAGCYWYNEDADSMVIDVECIVEGATLNDFADYVKCE
jgi:hypothetical protein